MDSFASNFNQFFGSVISEVQIGLGPAGILRMSRAREKGERRAKREK